MSSEAEKHVLGVLLLSPERFDEVSEVITLEDFFEPRNGLIFASIQKLVSEAAGVDVVTVTQQLQTDGHLQRVGGPGYLHDLTELPATLVNVAYHARIMAEDSTRRRLVAAGMRIMDLAKSGKGKVDELVEQCRAELDQTSRSVSGVWLLRDRIDQSLAALEDPTPVVPTPWADLNQYIHGWGPGRVYVVGARPAIGKSIFAIDSAIGLAQEGYVAVSSLEMSEQELHYRILSNRAQVYGNRFESRDLTNLDRQKIGEKLSAVKDLRISIDARPSQTITDIRSHARSVARLGNLSGVVVDYLQLMGSGSSKARHEQVAEFSRGLKLLAKELQVPVIALSQLNRGLESRPGGRPSMADLRESGAIEQDADVILLLHKENADDADDPEMEVIVGKNRHGATGAFRLIRKGFYSTLSDKQWRPL